MLAGWAPNPSPSPSPDPNPNPRPDPNPDPNPNPNPNPHPNPHPNQVRAFGPQSGKLLYVINDAHKLIGVGEPTP